MKVNLTPIPHLVRKNQKFADSCVTFGFCVQSMCAFLHSCKSSKCLLVRKLIAEFAVAFTDRLFLTFLTKCANYFSFQQSVPLSPVFN